MERGGVLVGGAGVGVGDVVLLGHEPGGQVQPAASGGGVRGVLVGGAGPADGVGGVVDGGEHGAEGIGGEGEVGGGADQAGAGVGGCPLGAVVGQPPGPQGEVGDSRRRRGCGRVRGVRRC